MPNGLPFLQLPVVCMELPFVYIIATMCFFIAIEIFLDCQVQLYLKECFVFYQACAVESIKFGSGAVSALFCFCCNSLAVQAVSSPSNVITNELLFLFAM